MNSASAAVAPSVLVVDDEPVLSGTVKNYLERAGMSAQTCGDGLVALDLVRATAPDVVVLDLGLPGMDGVEVCRQLRTFSDCYVLMLTARADEVDKLIGLSVGADDYMTKPFSPREVAARVKAILKRTAPRVAPVVEVAGKGPFEVDEDRFLIHYHGQPLGLTRHEFRLLQTLLARPERVFSREQLLDALGVAADAGYERNVDSHIKGLRAKLRQVDATAEPIQTHRGLGYSYAPDKS